MSRLFTFPNSLSEKLIIVDDSMEDWQSDMVQNDIFHLYK